MTYLFLIILLILAPLLILIYISQFYEHRKQIIDFAVLNITWPNNLYFIHKSHEFVYVFNYEPSTFMNDNIPLLTQDVFYYLVSLLYFFFLLIYVIYVMICIYFSYKIKISISKLIYIISLLCVNVILIVFCIFGNHLDYADILGGYTLFDFNYLLFLILNLFTICAIFYKPLSLKVNYKEYKSIIFKHYKEYDFLYLLTLFLFIIYIYFILYPESLEYLFKIIYSLDIPLIYIDEDTFLLMLLMLILLTLLLLIINRSF